MISYTPLMVTSFIRDLFQNMFFEYGGEIYGWHPDPRKSKISITTVNDQHSDQRIQLFPRIIIQRGPTACQSQFIGNNLLSYQGGGVPEGGSEEFRQDLSGSIYLIVEGLNEGTCEEVAEYCRRFICWCKPFIESMFGFQAFGKVVQISECNMETEETEKFKISINIPYIVEDYWQKTGNLMKLNHIFLSMISGDNTNT